MTSLFTYLMTRDPPLDTTNVKGGVNSFNSLWDEVEDYADWPDFTFQNMTAMLGPVLARNFPANQLDAPAPLRGALNRVVDETTVTAVLLKWTHTIVGCALERASESMGAVKPLAWAMGGHAQGRREGSATILPDWAGVKLDQPAPVMNLVPGDSKVSGKWRWDMRNESAHRVEFFKPLKQVTHYARQLGTRYAYIITDRELLLIRRSVSEHPGTPAAVKRPQRVGAPVGPPRTPTRQPLQVHRNPISLPGFQVRPPVLSEQQRSQYVPLRGFTPPRRPANAPSTPTTIHSSPGNHGSPAYTDGGNPDLNESPIQVARILWGENRPGHLTVNLALFWIHVLAAFETDLRSSYTTLGREFADLHGIPFP